MTAGKTCKTIAAGPGKPPVVVDETANFPKMRPGCDFWGQLRQQRALHRGEGGHLVTARPGPVPRGHAPGPPRLRAFRRPGRRDDQARHQGGGRGCKDPGLNRDFVGKDAAFIARGIGLLVPEPTRLLWAEVPNDHPLVWTEQLMPVLPVTTVRRPWTPAIELAYQAEGENHHTAAMHSINVDHLTRMGRRMQCSIFVKNAPTFYGLGLGEGYASMSIGTPTGDGLTKAAHFARPLHCSLVGYFRIT